MGLCLSKSPDKSLSGLGVARSSKVLPASGNVQQGAANAHFDCTAPQPFSTLPRHLAAHILELVSFPERLHLASVNSSWRDLLRREVQYDLEIPAGETQAWPPSEPAKPRSVEYTRSVSAWLRGHASGVRNLKWRVNPLDAGSFSPLLLRATVLQTLWLDLGDQPPAHALLSFLQDARLREVYVEHTNREAAPSLWGTDVLMFRLAAPSQHASANLSNTASVAELAATRFPDHESLLAMQHLDLLHVVEPVESIPDLSAANISKLALYVVDRAATDPCLDMLRYAGEVTLAYEVTHPASRLPTANLTNLAALVYIWGYYPGHTIDVSFLERCSALHTLAVRCMHLPPDGQVVLSMEDSLAGLARLHHLKDLAINITFFTLCLDSLTSPGFKLESLQLTAFGIFLVDQTNQQTGKRLGPGLKIMQAGFGFCRQIWQEGEGLKAIMKTRNDLDMGPLLDSIVSNMANAKVQRRPESGVELLGTPVFYTATVQD
ncbi:hypothetical protein WJX72_002109 [[Myrmecia] bisecta]|uniref:F-box domain-containing protein n=1 Tax=[Myrmecia] bisecta TaxID=41462 RepID=A0AAW1PPL2_9CHLO